MIASPWTLSGTQARLRLPHFEAAIDLGRADAGLGDVKVESVVCHDLSLLGVFAPNLTLDSTASEPLDSYVRENDLVATFGESDGQKRRLQAYWRVVPFDATTADAIVLELVVSVQTDLLESHPAMFVVSKFPSGELLPFAADDDGECQVVGDNASERPADFMLIRPAGSNVSFMQASHPEDCVNTEIVSSADQSAGIAMRHAMFAEQLEKGVIRRSRVRVAMLRREEDDKLASRCFRQFAASEPVLTV